MVKHSKSIKEAVEILQEGRVVAFPTGTSYGLAVDALQGHALQRLRNLKKRPKEKSFSIFMNEEVWSRWLKLTVQEEAVLKQYANQPVTVLVTPHPDLEHLAQDGLVAIRIIDHPVMKELAEAMLVPLTATSANLAGQEPCFNPQDIAIQFPGKIDETTYDLSLGLILDGGELPPHPPSTIIKPGVGEVSRTTAPTSPPV